MADRRSMVTARWRRVARIVVLTCALGCVSGAGAEAGFARAEAAGAGDARTQAVVDWNLTALSTASVSSGVREGHDVALAQAAVFDAVNSISRVYAPYRVRIEADGSESVQAAIASAAHTVLVARYPEQQADLDAALASSLGGVPDGDSKAKGIAVGRAAAAALLALRDGDGSDDEVPYTPGSGPGVWIPTPPRFSPALEPGWGLVTPFLLRSGSQFRPPPPPALTSRAYTRDFREIKAIGEADSNSRTAAQTQAALFWNATGAKIWNQAAQQLVLRQGHGPTTAARAFALLNLAGADAVIATWDAKFAYSQWRPVTAIRAADTDGNPATSGDPDWSPLLVTPPYPDYVSAASTVAGAAETVLSDVFGERPGSFSLISPGLPGVVRSFDSFSAAAGEDVDARVWAGIHWRTSDRVGQALGRRVARFALRHALRPGRP
jgi:PAP2 superfamily